MKVLSNRHQTAVYVLLLILKVLSVQSAKEEDEEEEEDYDDTSLEEDDPLERITKKNIREDSSFKVDKLITKYGYQAEVHRVTTDDGYILTMHRIRNTGGSPVFLQHGLVDSSAGFVIMGPNVSLGYFLHDKGYDVWMGNARGNRYSRNHTKLDPDIEPEFWKFSWHEIGIYDIPAMIDYILEKTNSEKLFYVGHSQGTTAMFVLLSTRPEYNQKLSLVQAMAPVAFLGHIRTPLESLGNVFIPLLAKSRLEVMPHSNNLKKVCFISKQTEDMCIHFVFQLMGEDMEQFNRTKFYTIFGHVPAGCSVRQLLHYQQLIKSKKFRQYDYGVDNLKVYNQTAPFDYEVGKITAPIVMHYSLNDFLSEPVDVLRLSAMLTDVELNKIPFPKWNHMDFLYAIDVRKMLYDDIEKYNLKYK